MVLLFVNLNQHTPDHPNKCFDAIDETLLLRFTHRVIGIPDFDRHFGESQTVVVDFANHFAIVFVLVGLGVDNCRSKMRIGPKTGLTIGDMEAVKKICHHVSYFVSNYLEKGHFPSFLWPCPKNNIAMALYDGLYQLIDIRWVMLAIAIHSNHNVSAEPIGGDDPGFRRRPFPPVDPMPEGQDPFALRNSPKGTVPAAVVNDYDPIVASGSDFPYDFGDNRLLVESGNDNDYDRNHAGPSMNTMVIGNTALPSWPAGRIICLIAVPERGEDTELIGYARAKDDGKTKKHFTRPRLKKPNNRH
jgi:hypothetical protein